MQPTFEKLALIARAVEAFHSQKRSQFDKLTRMASKGTLDIAFSKMSPSRIKTKLAEYRQDIDASAELLSEIRSDIVVLAEGTPDPRPPPPANGTGLRPYEE